MTEEFPNNDPVAQGMELLRQRIEKMKDLLERAYGLLDLELDCVPFGDMGEVEWQRKREEWLRDVGVKK